MLQRDTTICFLALVLLLPGLSLGFVLRPATTEIRKIGMSSSVSDIIKNKYHTILQMSDEDNTESSNGRRRRRKRKAQVDKESSDEDEETDSAPEVPVMELKPRDDTPVQLQVKDVRELVGGSVPTEGSSVEESSPSWASRLVASASASVSASKNPASSSKSVRVSSSSTSSPSSIDDSLERLLEDARRMKEEENDGLSDDEDSDSMKAKIRNVLSTIVTADFFIVCGFLLWFLLGIFCSSVLKDDTVQILFNNNFETLVQPALGILMIAAVAGNFFKEDEGTEGY